VEAVELTAKAFPDFVRDHRCAVVHCWAVWNNYDVTMRQRLRELPEEIRLRIPFGEMDVDVAEHSPLLLAHNVINLPALILYRDGVHAQTAIGLRTPEQLAIMMKDLIRDDTEELRGGVPA